MPNLFLPVVYAFLSVVTDASEIEVVFGQRLIFLGMEKSWSSIVSLTHLIGTREYHISNPILYVTCFHGTNLSSVKTLVWKLPLISELQENSFLAFKMFQLEAAILEGRLPYQILSTSILITANRPIDPSCTFFVELVTSTNVVKVVIYTTKPNFSSII